MLVLIGGVLSKGGFLSCLYPPLTRKYYICEKIIIMFGFVFFVCFAIIFFITSVLLIVKLCIDYANYSDSISLAILVFISLVCFIMCSFASFHFYSLIF